MRRCEFCERELPEGKRADAKHCDDICGRESRRQESRSEAEKASVRFWDRYRQIVRRSPARLPVAVSS